MEGQQNRAKKIIQKGSVYFFYRPKIEHEDIQRFFFILKPKKQKK